MPIAIPEIKNVLYFIVTITTKKIITKLICKMQICKIETQVNWIDKF